MESTQLGQTEYLLRLRERGGVWREEGKRKVGGGWRERKVKGGWREKGGCMGGS